jgi:hypothetical protein
MNSLLKQITAKITERIIRKTKTILLFSEVFFTGIFSLKVFFAIDIYP